MLQYCGKECQTADRLEHKKDCMKKEKNEKAYDLASRTWKPTWWRVRYEPSFLNELFLAGNFAGQVTGYDVSYLEH